LSSEDPPKQGARTIAAMIATPDKPLMFMAYLPL
jgi:hypothetical protein